ncbi:hypothetical protein CSA17_00185 [bacterium DOLJORAL78_65_58]|nr:MAG: hypothetical protein CSA17_00185 [bacterium DOLJORAL78_65_58]
MSARINATVYLPDLLPKVVEAVQEINGFGRVVLYIWSDETQAFEARAFGGVDDLEKPALIGQQITYDLYEEWAHPQHRWSHCSLLLGQADPVAPGYEPSRPAGEGVRDRNWRAGTRLIAPLISLKGEVIGFLDLDEPQTGLIPDVLEVKHLEFLVQQVATAVESAGVYDSLARKNAELSLASEKLDSLADMKNQFVANVSHELRTPLTSISAYTELLQNNMDSMTTEMRSEFLKVINSQSAKLTGIIDDILNLGQMANGRSQVHTVETDLVVLIRRLEDSWRSRALEQDIRFKVEAEVENIRLPIDAVLFQQLLGHLLNNAFKFTNAGGMVTVRVQERGTAVRLQVQDTGIGIPEDKLGVIFDRFYQVDGSSTRQHNGQGVGLAICRDIVDHHDGRIWADNVETGGTRFTVVLPRRPLVVQATDHHLSLGTPFEPGEFMQRLMHWVSESMGVETATLMTPDKSGEHLTIRAGIGVSDSVVQSARVRRGHGFAGKVWATHKTLLIEDMTGDQHSNQDVSEPRYSTPSLLCVPLLNGKELVGVISVNNKSNGQVLDANDALFLESLAPRLTSLLLRYRHWQEEVRDFQAVRQALRLTTAVGSTRHQSVRQVCQEICLETARSINMPEDELEHLAFSLQFYDVGLGAVPAQLLNKPGPLVEQDKIQMQKHVHTGLEILAPLQPDSKVRQLILHHHENYDGTGYPMGLAGESIPLGSRLVRLADTLAALLSPRPWRGPYSVGQALAEIRTQVGSVFCPRMAAVFLEVAEDNRERIGRSQEECRDGHTLLRPVPMLEEKPCIRS